MVMLRSCRSATPAMPILAFVRCTANMRFRNAQSPRRNPVTTRMRSVLPTDRNLPPLLLPKNERSFTLCLAQRKICKPSEELAQLIGETVFRLVRQIIEAAPVDADWLHQQAQKAADVISECDAARTAWLHPDDATLIDPATFPLPVMADPAAERGTIRIDCSAGWVEHGRSNHLDALRVALSLEEAA
jgi:hypothetical protein